MLCVLSIGNIEKRLNDLLHVGGRWKRELHFNGSRGSLPFKTTIMKLPLPKHTLIIHPDGYPWYTKMGNNEWDWWLCLTSTYVVEIYKNNKIIDYYSRTESDKPIYNKEGKLNRFGFKWTDQQVINYYKHIKCIQ